MSDEDDGLESLNIKPPQAFVAKPSRSKHSERHVRHSRSSSSSHHKSHHHAHHREERRRRHRERAAEAGAREYEKEITVIRPSEVLMEPRSRNREEIRSSHRSRHEMRRESRREEKEARKKIERMHRSEEVEREREREERFSSSDKFASDIVDRKQRSKEMDLREKLHKKKIDPKEKQERDERRNRILIAEKLKEEFGREMEERRKKNGLERSDRSRSRSRSPSRRAEPDEMKQRREMEEAGLVVVSDESVSPTPLEPTPQASPIHSPNRVTSSSSSSSKADNDDEDEDEDDSSSSSGSSTSSGSTDEEEEANGKDDHDFNRKTESPPLVRTNHDVDEDIELEKDTLPPAAPLPPYLPAIQGCRSVEEFHCLNRIEEGTYGVVYRARDKRTNEIVALKRLKMEKEKEGFPITSLREISTLLKAQHPNIVTVREIVVGSNMDKIYIVMDYVEHDLKSLMKMMKSKNQVFIPGEIKCLMQQLLNAVAHLHDNWILHRDLKASNLLLSHKGILKVGDFGLAREYGSPLKPYTPIVVTLWYRSPELLLCTKEYSTKIDMWSVGCIFAEFLTMEPLFQGKNEYNQIHKIFEVLGTPNDTVWPGYSQYPLCQKMNLPNIPGTSLKAKFAGMISEAGLKLLQDFLTYDPKQRISADDALKSSYFTELPHAIDPSMFPTWPAKSEQGHRKTVASPKAPSGGQIYKNMEEDERFHMGGVVDHYRQNIGAGFSLKF